MDVVYSAEPALQMDVACPRSSFDSFRSSWISDTADGARAASSFSSDMSLGSLSGLPSLGSDFFGGDSGAGMAELVETRQRPPSPAPPLDAASTAAAGPGASVIHCYEAALQVANGFPTPPCEPSTLRGHTLRAQLNAAAPEVPPPQMMMRGQHKADGIPAAFQTADPPAAPAATLMPVSTAAAPHGCHPVAAKAFAAQCVLRPGAYPARELHKIPTPAELEQSILAIRLRIEQAAKQQSQSVCHRGQKGKGSHSIEQLMMQLKILSRDYYSKLCAYIESVNKIVAEHQRLISQRNDILPVTDGALNAKLVAPTRQCQEVVTKALAHLEKDAQQLLQEFCSQHLKKKEKLPDRSTEVLREWLGEHFQHPYPTSQEKRALMAQTGLSLKQINQWFINARVRVWRPAVALMMTESSQLS